ncbi:hypothetical protein Tco_0429779, partial [Tanacetum coccineum]
DNMSISSSNVTLSVELTNFEHTNLSINSKSTEVDAPPVNDDNANANEGNAEDDVYAHVLDDDDVVVSDDDEVNPSTNVEEFFFEWNCFYMFKCVILHLNGIVFICLNV